MFLPFSDKSTHFKIDKELPHFKEFFSKQLFLKAYGYTELIPKINCLIKFSEKKM